MFFNWANSFLLFLLFVWVAPAHHVWLSQMSFWYKCSSWRISLFALQAATSSALDTMCLFICRRTQINVLLCVICTFGRGPWKKVICSVAWSMRLSWALLESIRPWTDLPSLAFPTLCRSFRIQLCGSYLPSTCNHFCWYVTFQNSVSSWVQLVVKLSRQKHIHVHTHTLPHAYTCTHSWPHQLTQAKPTALVQTQTALMASSCCPLWLIRIEAH